MSPEFSKLWRILFIFIFNFYFLLLCLIVYVFSFEETPNQSLPSYLGSSTFSGELDTGTGTGTDTGPLVQAHTGEF